MFLMTLKAVMSFQPDIIALSCTEDMFNLGLALIEKVTPENTDYRRWRLSDIRPATDPGMHPCIDIVCK